MLSFDFVVKSGKGYHSCVEYSSLDNSGIHIIKLLPSLSLSLSLFLSLSMENINFFNNFYYILYYSFLERFKWKKKIWNSFLEFPCLFFFFLILIIYLCKIALSIHSFWWNWRALDQLLNLKWPTESTGVSCIIFLKIHVTIEIFGSIS